MSYKPCPFCGEKNIQRGYGTGVDGPWIGCPSCQYWIRGNDCVRRWNSRYYEKEITHLKGRIEQLEKEKAKMSANVNTEELKEAAIALVQRLELDKDVKKNNWWLNERAKIMELIDDNEEA